MPEQTDPAQMDLTPEMYDDLDIDWTKVIVALITATVTLVGTVGTVYLRHVLNNDEDRISVALESSRRINARLQDVREDADADRVVISQFHNGVRFASGRSYEKITTTHEITAPGIAPSQDKVKALPITLFEDVLLEVRDMGAASYRDIGVIPNSGVENLLKRGGVRSVYFFRLDDIRGRYIGILQIEYVGESYELTPAQVEDLKNASRAIGAYLSTEKERIRDR